MICSDNEILVRIDIIGGPIPNNHIMASFRLDTNEWDDTSPATLAQKLLEALNRSGRNIRDYIDPEYNDRLISEMEALHNNGLSF